ncbi:hypothetical protein [Geitlerinema sp. PCC 9228]|jgi:tetratricopeptide (TPR) repeat protein|uniref:tetratricopeptide repeat protein n=1 Tax=Geitlerinema sp. PCC 9228 TaxID=111611 RepID=UPI0008F9CBFE|nr:hypothetical protein [Geitlerinema sp. PCC 9228]
MSEKTAEELFNEGVERYHAGENPEDLIPLFKTVCDRASKNSPPWTSLAWLYLLTDQPKAAYKAASKAVKYNPHDPQARVNLAIAMLETNKKGVRDHIDKANQLMVTSSDLRQELQQNFTDGLKRKPDWKSLQKVQNWLFGS